MSAPLLWLTAGLDPLVAAGLVAASFASSFITVSLGIGGGVTLLAIMASLLPPAALIPVHGVVQLGSNGFRALLLLKHVHWPPVISFALGSLVGVALGGWLVIDLPPGLVQIGIGLFVIWSVAAKPPVWLSRAPWLTGGVAAFLTMFFGATGPFVANFVKSLGLPRQSYVGTHGTLMTLQHGLKIVTFGVLGFTFAPWIGFTLAMIAAGFLGTLAGRQLLFRMQEATFRTALNVMLILVSIRLIGVGLYDLL